MKLFFLPALAALMIFSSCLKLSEQENIKSDVQIKLFEYIDSTKRDFYLLCYTKDTYECMNYGIGHIVDKSSNKVSIDFQGIVKPYMCATALGPATASINLGTLAQGATPFEFSVEGKSTQASLENSQAYYEMTLTSPQSLSLFYQRLYKVPENTIWGWVGYHAETTAALAQSLTDSLQTLGAYDVELTEGQYGYFSINEEAQMVAPQNHGYNFILPFVFGYEQNEKELGRLLKRFGEREGSKLKIVVYTSKGNTFMSWQP